ncbi:MAG TPA: hypothetical protein PK971_11475, partial [Saprospiraceae bacterium]|nr:hypothetical protein [Saprospiraceae bacterium]
MNAPSHQITLQSKFCDVDYTATLNPSFHSLEFSLEGPDKACQNIAVEYVVVPANATSYTWYIDGNVIPGQTGPVLDILFPFVGTVTIRVRIEGPNGCLGFANLEKIVTVLPNPMPSITQQGVLYCDEKGMTTLITQVPSGGGSSFEWQHFENGGFVPVDQSAFSAFYTPNGANLDIQYIPGGGMLGLFRVLVSGGECISEATRNVSCVPAISDPGGPIPVIFTAWQYDAACGQVWASGELSCEALINSWFQVLDPSLPNPFYADPQEICNPNVLIGTFTHPGVYQVALIGEFDFDGHGPNPPVRYADIREITIPYVLGFTSRITCVNNQSGSYMVDLLNLTQQIPQYPNVEWTWTIDGNVHSHDLNPPPYEIQAGQSIHVCLRAHVQVPDDEDPELRKDYDCEICEQISAPTDLTVSIEGVQSNTCDGILLQPTAGVSDPSLVLSYTWVLENSTHNVHYESNIAEPVFAPPSQDTYTLSVTVMFSNGCTATATQDVVVAPGNIVHIYILNTPATCGERILTAETDPPNLPVTYLWSSGQTTSEITVTVTGTYTVTVTETATGCTKTNSASLVINGPFIGGYSGQFIQCEGESDLKVSVIVRPGYTYTLTLSNGQSSTYTATGILPWEIPLNPSSLPAGTYSFVITAEETATNLPCTTQLTGILQVNPA